MIRTASIYRKTNETEISAEISLDGAGLYAIDTKIAFLNHMLEQLSRHSLIDIQLQASGDTDIDFHHTVEDTGYVIGEAINQALGDRKGIERYGYVYLPMDETLTRVALDFSNRPHLIWNTRFTCQKLGDFDTELFKEWFQAFVHSAGVSLHVETLYGDNNHHIAESCFKGLARALKSAVVIDPRQMGTMPSTKGVLGGSL